MSIHSELFACYGAPLVLGNHGDPNAVRFENSAGEDIPCTVASVGHIEYTNETVTHEAGNITERVARCPITLDITPPLDAVAIIEGERWAIEDIASAGTLTRASLIRVMAAMYGSKQIT